MTKQIIPYQPIDLQEPKEIVDAVRKRRGGTLLNLDRMLLNSPNLTRGWNALLKEVRENLSLDARYKEIGMCGVAILNRAEYEFFHHAPELLKAGGTQQQVDEILDKISRSGYDCLTKEEKEFLFKAGKYCCLKF
jgi:alkylhydroperoxidase/carboxymuconolactone decarboxylase family protein YurZ